MSMMFCNNCSTVWDSDFHDCCPVCLSPTREELEACAVGLREQIKALEQECHFACMSDDFAYTNGTREGYMSRIRALKAALRDTEADIKAMA